MRSWENTIIAPPMGRVVFCTFLFCDSYGIEPPMSSRSTPPTPLAQVLESMLENKGLSPKLAQYAMFEDWEKVVGKGLAEKTRPVRMQGNQMVIEVEHSTWIPELQFMKPKLLEKIREVFPQTAISDLRFILRSSSEGNP